MQTQSAVYDAFGMARVPEERHRKKLVTAMGFEGQWEDHRAFQMAFLKQAGLTAQSRFLEFGSGPLTLAIPLMQELDPGHYTGVDVRGSVMNLAYSEVSRAGLADRNPRLIVAKDFGATALGEDRFDIIWSFSVLYHLTDELVEELFSTIPRRLAPGGRYWANISDTMEDSRWLEFPFLNRKLEFYEAVAERHGLSITPLGTIAELGFAGRGGERQNIMLEVTLKA